MIIINNWNPGQLISQVVGNDSMMIGSVKRFLRNRTHLMQGEKLECNIMTDYQKLGFLTNQCLYKKIAIRNPEAYLKLVFTIESIEYIACLDKWKIIPYQVKTNATDIKSWKLQFLQRKGKIPQKYLDIVYGCR